jgi:HEAT repeat protein
MRRLAVLLLLTGLGAGTAAAESPLRRQVLDYLGAIEGVSASDWRSLGPDAGPELLAIASDASASRSQRAGAALALGYFPSSDARSFLDARLGDEDSLLRRRACVALATGWGDDALPTLTRGMADRDTQVRTACVNAVATVRTAAARQALQARLAEESNASVRSALEAGLAGGAR